MKYPLEDLMFVRQFREDRAATEVTRQRARVLQAQKFVEQRQKELSEYIQWRIRCEQEKYAEIMNQPVLRKALDKVKTEIQILKANEDAFHDAVLQAQKELEEANVKLENNITVHRAATKKTDKLREHRKAWHSEALKEEEASQEKELEDFRTREEDEDDYFDTDDHVAEEFSYV